MHVMKLQCMYMKSPMITYSVLATLHVLPMLPYTLKHRHEKEEEDQEEEKRLSSYYSMINILFLLLVLYVAFFFLS